MPRMIGLGLYRFDINFRESAVVGMDPPQAEAVRATGAGWLQWLNYDVTPGRD
jgi:ABC-type phosphate/phosphonate transport system permease subunit